MGNLDSSEWGKFLSTQSDAHFLQTREWGNLKSRFGWQVSHITKDKVGAQILFRKLPLGYQLGYLPKGPVGGDLVDLWPLIDKECYARRAIFLRIEPDGWEKGDESGQNIGFGPGQSNLKIVKGQHNIQPRRTIIISLREDESAILARMKQKTRYNIRLAEKKGVIIKTSNDFASFHKLMVLTGNRDEFGVHSEEYYQLVYSLFSVQGKCEYFVAEYQEKILAGIIVIRQGPRAWYVYGASSNEYREFMPAYLLQWKAILWAKAAGCDQYDLWGVPDYSEDYLEKNFQQQDGGLWGVYRFKRGFGGEIKRSCAAFDRVYNPSLYRLFNFWEAKRGQYGA